MNQDRSPLATLIDTIGRSPIVVGRRAAPLPAGFNDVDAAILAWIATEGRRIGRASR